jgi:hypothetical protein
MAQWPLKPEVFEKYLLSKYADAYFICDAVRYGMPILHENADIPAFHAKNAKAAVHGPFRPQVDEVIADDLNHGWLSVPPACWKARHVHPVTAAPKNKENPDKVRVCQNQSAPLGRSINDHQRFAHAAWTHVQAIAKIISRDCYMMKLDVRYYYRNFGIYPPDWPSTACEWPPESGRQLFDTRASFGLRNMPEMAQRVTSSVAWIMHDAGHTGVIGLMDDFAIFADSPEACLRQFTALEALLQELGFEVHPPGSSESKRSSAPTKRLVLSGILWDSEKMVMALDSTKTQKLIDSITEFKVRRRRTLHEFQTIGGYLSWCSDMVDGGRLFTRRFWDATAGAKHKHHHCSLTRAVHLDLDWWTTNLERYNGTAHALPASDRRPILRIVTDATGHGDVGIYYNGAFVHLTRSEVGDVVPEIPEGCHHVQTWEAAAPLCAFRLFRDLMANHEVHCLVDNTAAKAGFSRGVIKHEATRCVLRAAFYETRANNARICLGWIPGKSNPIADAVSRIREPGQAVRLAELLQMEFDHGSLPGNRRPRLGWLFSLPPDPNYEPEHYTQV